jgi:hypothetical protein
MVPENKQSFWKLSAKASLGIDRRTAVRRSWIAAAWRQSKNNVSTLNQCRKFTLITDGI